MRRFEDLIAWQKARQLAKDVYVATRRGGFAQDRGLSARIQCAVTSIMSKVAEGFERSRPREFHQALSVAKASCAEVRSQLYLAHDVGYLTTEASTDLLGKAEEVGRLVGGLRSSVERQLAKAAPGVKDSGLRTQDSAPE